MLSLKDLTALRRCLLIVLGWLCLANGAQAANTVLNFNGSSIGYCTAYNSSTQTYTCPSFTSTQDITIASGYTVVLSGAMDFDFNQQLNMSGTAALRTTGNMDIGDIKPSNLNISGGTLTATGGNFKIGSQAQTITANINATTMTIGTGSNTQITGTLTATGAISLGSHATIIGPISGTTISTNSPVSITGNVTASTSFTLPSGSTMVGNIVSPVVSLLASSSTVQGNITATTSLTIESGNAVTGNVTSGNLTMDASNARITGSVNVTGNLNIGSGDTINGNVVVSGNVVTQDSNGYISGNLSTNTVTLGWAGRVGGTITCTGATPSSPTCSCVTNNSGYAINSTNGPHCAAAVSSALHHIQIRHPNSSLTCQPQTVEITACANSNCTTPHYTGGATVTLTPGARSFVIDSSGINTAATVQQTTVGTGLATLSATVSGSSSVGYSCINTVTGATNCQMPVTNVQFSFIVPDHLAETAQTFTISALQASTNNPAICTPLFTSTRAVNFTCSYVNPASGTVPLRISSNGGTAYAALSGNVSSACTSGGAPRNVAFNANGQATLNLLYADAGKMTLTATYTGQAATGDAGLIVTGSDDFIATPSSYLLDLIQTASQVMSTSVPSNSSAAPFARASESFSARVTAFNSIGVATRNFGQENPTGMVVLTHTLVDPIPGVSGSLTSGSAGAFTNGSSTISGIKWSEVGIIKLTATLSPSGLYQGLSNTLLGASINGNIGRFIPDHFTTSFTSPLPSTAIAPMTCPTTGANIFPVTCVGGQFIYTGQPLNLTIKAYNGASSPAVTQNYTGNYAHTPTVTAWSAAGNTSNANPEYIAGTNTLTNTGAVTLTQAFSYTNGIGSGSVSYAFNNIRSKPTDVYFRASETDGTSPNTFSVTSAQPSGSVEAGITVASGRLLVANNYGSELLRMPIGVTAQYWSGSQYVTSSTDNYVSSAQLASNVAFTQCTKNLTSGGAVCTTAVRVDTAPATLTFSAGRASFKLAAPGSGNNGSADVKVNAISYLPSTTSRVVFGVYKSGPVIYIREVY
ncbi:MAG: polymer-forming cytoskeletal protein [Pseudomonadota bacterium]